MKKLLPFIVIATIAAIPITIIVATSEDQKECDSLDGRWFFGCYSMIKVPK